MSFRHFRLAVVTLLISGMAFAGAAHRKMQKEVEEAWTKEFATIGTACGCKDPVKVDIDWPSYNKVDKTKVDGTTARLKSEVTELAKVYTTFCNADAENKAVACKSANKVTVKLSYGGTDGGKIDAAKKLVWEFSNDSEYTAGYRLKDMVDELE